MRVRHFLVRPTWAPGKRLDDESWMGSGGHVLMTEGRFEGTFKISAPGIYEICLLPEGETEPLAKFRLACWDDRLAAGGVSLFAELQNLAGAVASHMGGWERLASDEESFKNGATALLKKVRSSSASRLYPASASELDAHLNHLSGNHKNFKFEKGRFKEVRRHSWHLDPPPVATLRDEPYTFANFRRYVREVPPLAAREFGLWVVRDMRRRRDDRIRPEFEALLKEPPTPLAPWAARLPAARPDRLDALEAEPRAPSP